MQPRTPQKKSVEEPKHDTINSSYIFSVPNSSNLMLSNESGVLGEAGQLKNSHGSISVNKNNKIHNPSNKISLVRKYAQQDLQTRNKYSCNSKETKQYREVVVSEEFVRSHHLYKMLKEQMAIADARHQRQTDTLNQLLSHCEGEAKEAKAHNHQIKVELWEYKTQLMQLKSLLEEEEEDNRKLVEEYQRYREVDSNEAGQGDEPHPEEDEVHPEEDEVEQDQRQIQDESRSGQQNLETKSRVDVFDSEEQKNYKECARWESEQNGRPQQGTKSPTHFLEDPDNEVQQIIKLEQLPEGKEGS